MAIPPPSPQSPRSLPPLGRTLPQLFSDLVSQVTNLFHTEVRLVRAEFSEKLHQLIYAAAFLIGGAVLALAGVFMLLQSIVAWLVVAGLPVQWATLLVALVFGIGGYLVVNAGLSKLEPTKLAPERTMSQLQQDISVAKEQV